MTQLQWLQNRHSIATNMSYKYLEQQNLLLSEFWRGKAVAYHAVINQLLVGEEESKD